MINLDNVDIILNHFYDDEISHLEEMEEMEGEELPEDLVDAIALIERKGLTDHIAYNLMKLKLYLQKQ